jgi:hypothetical protein
MKGVKMKRVLIVFILHTLFLTLSPTAINSEFSNPPNYPLLPEGQRVYSGNTFFEPCITFSGGGMSLNTYNIKRASNYCFVLNKKMNILGGFSTIAEKNIFFSGCHLKQNFCDYDYINETEKEGSITYFKSDDGTIDFFINGKNTKYFPWLGYIVVNESNNETLIIDGVKLSLIQRFSSNLSEKKINVIPITRDICLVSNVYGDYNICDIYTKFIYYPNLVNYAFNYNTFASTTMFFDCENKKLVNIQDIVKIDKFSWVIVRPSWIDYVLFKKKSSIPQFLLRISKDGHIIEKIDLLPLSQNINVKVIDTNKDYIIFSFSDENEKNNWGIWNFRLNSFTQITSIGYANKVNMHRSLTDGFLTDEYAYITSKSGSLKIDLPNGIIIGEFYFPNPDLVSIYNVNDMPFIVCPSKPEIYDKCMFQGYFLNQELLPNQGMPIYFETIPHYLTQLGTNLISLYYRQNGDIEIINHTSGRCSKFNINGFPFSKNVVRYIDRLCILTNFNELTLVRLDNLDVEKVLIKGVDIDFDPKDTFTNVYTNVYEKYYFIHYYNVVTQMSFVNIIDLEQNKVIFADYLKNYQHFNLEEKYFFGTYKNSLIFSRNNGIYIINIDEPNLISLNGVAFGIIENYLYYITNNHNTSSDLMLYNMQELTHHLIKKDFSINDQSNRIEIINNSIFVNDKIYNIKGELIQKGLTNKEQVILYNNLYNFIGNTDNKTKINSVIKYNPCPSFIIKKFLSDGDKISLVVENTSNNLTLEGKYFLLPCNKEGLIAPFIKMTKTNDIEFNLGHNEEIRIEADANINNSTDYFALIIESNGLLNTKNSELSDFDKEGRPLFDGVPTSLEKQQAIVVTVWKK